MSAILDHLTAIYGSESANQILPRLTAQIDNFRLRHSQSSLTPTPPDQRLSEQDVILITYGDQISEPGKTPLHSLGELLTQRAADVISGVHILPFYPYSSDDGFSVIDYKTVHPEMGDWPDVAELGHHFRLMFDAVINHISQHSEWFQSFLKKEAPYTGYFVTVSPETDLSQVVRPRTLPLLTRFETAHGPEYVWTTFSEDQIDLNYASPDLLLDVIDVLLFYVEKGASLIRLDAIAFMWKEIGTSCLHLPQTHRIIQLMRAVLDQAAPNTILVTETNVPHAENISYFGDGFNEAQMVYNFSLPPLALHAFASGDATHLQRWAATLGTPSQQTTYFNFMASHDGVGVRPVEGILRPEQVAELCQRVASHGGHVSYKTNPDGSQSPYELNITYYDALNNPHSDEPQTLQVDRFMASQAILLAMRGVPGIYVHSLFGSRNWNAGVAETRRYRTINRQKFDRASLETELDDPNSVRHQVFNRYAQLIAARRASPAFHPNGAQQILQTAASLFAFLRVSPDENERVLCIHNVTNRAQTFSIYGEDLSGIQGAQGIDLISGETFDLTSDRFGLPVSAYGTRWIRILTD